MKLEIKYVRNFAVGILVWRVFPILLGEQTLPLYRCRGYVEELD